MTDQHPAALETDEDRPPTPYDPTDPEEAEFLGIAAPETDVSALTEAVLRELGVCEFRETVADSSMCHCGLPALNHDAVADQIVMSDHPTIAALLAGLTATRERLRVVEGEREAEEERANENATLVHQARMVAEEALGFAETWQTRAESAEAVVAKVERIVADAEERDRQSLSRTFNGGTFGAYIPAADLRALLPGDGR